VKVKVEGTGDGAVALSPFTFLVSPSPFTFHLSRFTPYRPMTLSRDDALAIMHDYTASDALRKHMYAVEIAMRAMAERAGEDAEAWGLVGLLHDFDYERFPNAAHSATEEHPAEGVRILAGKGLPEPLQRAILGHANYPGVHRDTAMARALFAVDELCGFLVACALVRPSRSLQDLEVSSVKKKLKDKAFARGVNREDVVQGAAELGVALDDHIAFVLAALRPHERVLGLGSP
jgi:putative nucleotidyltransferase with HDIG domain